MDESLEISRVGFLLLGFSIAVSGSLNRWDRYHIITQEAIYTWYISGILPIG